MLTLQKTFNYNGNTQEFIDNYTEYKQLAICASTPQLKFITNGEGKDLIIEKKSTGSLLTKNTNFSIEESSYQIDLTDTLQKTLDSGDYETAFGKIMEDAFLNNSNDDTQIFNQLSIPINVSIRTADGAEQGNQQFEGFVFLTALIPSKPPFLDGIAPQKIPEGR